MKLTGAAPANFPPSELAIHDVSSLDKAGDNEVSLFFDRKSLDQFRRSNAACIITTQELAALAQSTKPLLIVKQPRLAYLQICELFYPDPEIVPEINESAQIHKTARLGVNCRVDAGAVVERGAEIGANTHIAQGVFIGQNVVLGESCQIGANTVISHAIIGSRVQIACCVSIGKPGFGYAEGPRGLVRATHLACVIIEDDVHIGSNCAIDRGVSDNTVIGAGTKIDNLVQIAHSVRIGRHCAIAAQVGIAGSSSIGDQVLIGGQAAISDHIHIGSRVRIAGKSGVVRNVADGEAVGGFPAVPIREWHRQTIAARKDASTRKS